MEDAVPSTAAAARGGARAAASPPEWSLARYRGRSWRRYAELALAGIAMAVLSATERRIVGLRLGVGAVACVLVAPALRPPLGALVTGAALTAACVAALRGRFDGVDGFIGLGSIVTFLVAISALGFHDEADRRRTWGEPRRFLPVEPGPLLSWSPPRARRLRFLADLADFALVGLVCLTFVLLAGSPGRAVLACGGIAVVLTGAFLRAPAWPLAAWAGTTLALVAAWDPVHTGWGGWALVVLQSGAVLAYARRAAWTHHVGMGSDADLSGSGSSGEQR